MDQRRAQLQRWLKKHYSGHVSKPVPASSDASFRRYFRVHVEGGTRIIMDAPPDRESIAPFASISARLSAMGLSVPEVEFADARAGFAVLSDLGKRSYLDALDGGADPHDLYPPALDALIVLQSKGKAYRGKLPAYDAKLLGAEIDLFWDWYWWRHRGLPLTFSLGRLRRTVSGILIEAALAQPRCFVHRDYHSRNLMARHRPGILDFQDAVAGPVTYDLVSLLQDCYVAWPQSQELEWVRYYREGARAAGIDLPSANEFDRAYDLMGIQRHLKAAGIFARLNYRDGKPGYLNDIPRTLAYVVRAARRYPVLDDFAALLVDHGVDTEALP